MALKKTEIFKAAPGFNHVAAQKTFDLVMKMDADEAQMFATLVVGEILEDTIEKNLRSVQGHLNKVIAKRMTKVRKAALVAAMNNTEGAEEFAKAFSVIAKEARDPFRESDYRRSSNGRFTNKVKVQSGVPLIKPRQARAMGIPEKKDSNGRALPVAQQKRFQQEYMQLSQFLDAVHSSSAPGTENDVLLTIKPGQGAPYTVKNRGTRPNGDLWNPEAGEKLIEMQARPQNLTAGGAAFGLTSALGGSPERGFRNARTTNAVDRNLGTFAQDWTRETDPRSSTAGTFNRLSAGSRFLGQVAPDGSTASIAAGLGQFVGSHGADAEKVFGPAARKTAYRYRGMTKEPDRLAVNAHDKAVRRQSQSGETIADRTQRRKQLEGQYNAEAFAALKGQRLTSADRNEIMANSNKRALAEMAPRTTLSATDKRAGINSLEQFLQTREVRPSGDLYNLQLEAGNTPPSQGFIVNRGGEVSAQAAGYGDDHYLPFNLKNLRGLKGGQYIRSRSVGGPTSEDIYAGVMSGATGFAVTSRSGTFYVDFQDDLGKRTPDKARRMTRRYEQLLDAVQSEQVDRMALDPEIRQAIVAGVKEEFPYASRREQESEVKTRIDDFKSSPELSEETDKIATFIAQNRSAAQGGSRDAQTYLMDAENLVAKEKEYKYRLNGDGYDAALKSLQEQFPYYLQVSYKPRGDEERLATSRDKGYVEPGRNRPIEAKAGLHGVRRRNNGVSGKFSAADANYQGYRSKEQNVPQERVETPAPATTQAAPAQAPKAQSTVADQAAASEKKAKVEDALLGVKTQINAANINMSDPSFQPVRDLLALDDEDFVRTLREDPATHDMLDRVVKDIETQVGGQNSELRRSINVYRQSSGDVGTKATYNSLVGRRFPETPFTFAEYDSLDDVAGELTKRGAAQGVVTNKRLRDMSEGELSNEVEAVRRLVDRSTGLDLSDLSLRDFKEFIGEDVDITSPTLTTFRQRGVNGLNEHLENVHRTRALKAKSGDSKPEVDIVVPPGRSAGSKQIDEKKRGLAGGISRALQVAEDGDVDEVEVTRIKRLQDRLEQADIINDPSLNKFMQDNAEDMALAQRMFQRDRQQ